MTGRTVSRWSRFYADGYDLSSNTMSFGPLTWEFDTPVMAGLDWAVQGGLPDHATLGIGTLNGIFDSTAVTGLHGVLNAAGATRTVMIPFGMRDAPVMGDIVYGGKFIQGAYQHTPGEGMQTVTVPFTAPDVTAGLNYQKPWGHLLHPRGQEAGANSANTNVDNGAATAAGGYLIYQIFAIAGAGTATVSVDDSANGTSWSALSGATSGAIATASAPTAGIIQLATTAAVRQYLRWQLALSGATGCTFALSFVRG